MKDLNKKAFNGLAFLFIFITVILFITAGTLNYWQAYIFLTVFFGSSFIITIYLMKNDPKLLERRVTAGPLNEKEKSQKIIQFLAQFAFLLIIVFPALDHRLIWSDVPTYMVLAWDVLVALGFYIVFLVFKENTFTSWIIEVADNQKVISTGPYGLVRHPMYSGALIMLFGLPLSLGSFWWLLTLIPIIFVIIWRLLDEEKFLEKNLSGYIEYKGKVKYRLIPYIW